MRPPAIISADIAASVARTRALRDELLAALKAQRQMGVAEFRQSYADRDTAVLADFAGIRCRADRLAICERHGISYQTLANIVFKENRRRAVRRTERALVRAQAAQSGASA